jgi:predicted nucleic acid-binding protein
VSIVSDASPLIALARIGQLELLSKLYQNVLLPNAVWEEVVSRGEELPGASATETAEWIMQRTVRNRTLVQALRQDLDAGEAEAIALAIEINPELLLMDEKRGRETARHLGLEYIGIIGVMIEAKHSGLVAAIRPHLDRLRQEAGFFISDALYQRVLRDEGEG